MHVLTAAYGYLMEGKYGCGEMYGNVQVEYEKN